MPESFARPILKEGKKFKVRVLRPSEYEAIRQGAVNESYQVQLDAALHTGMRYIELQRLYANPEWLGPPFVYLPRQAILKAKRTQLNRWVKLNDEGVLAVSRYLRGPKLPTWKTWAVWIREWAQRSALDPTGLGPKTTRKTWESWLAFYYGQNRLLEIVQNQGHTTGTSLHHYLSMPFLPKDREEMAKYVKGMFDSA